MSDRIEFNPGIINEARDRIIDAERNLATARDFLRSSDIPRDIDNPLEFDRKVDRNTWTRLVNLYGVSGTINNIRNNTNQTANWISGEMASVDQWRRNLPQGDNNSNVSQSNQQFDEHIIAFREHAQNQNNSQQTPINVADWLHDDHFTNVEIEGVNFITTSFRFVDKIHNQQRNELQRQLFEIHEFLIAAQLSVESRESLINDFQGIEAEYLRIMSALNDQRHEWEMQISMYNIDGTIVENYDAIIDEKLSVYIENVHINLINEFWAKYGTQITSLEYPDGSKVTNGEEFLNWMEFQKNNLAGERELFRNLKAIAIELPYSYVQYNSDYNRFASIETMIEANGKTGKQLFNIMNHHESDIAHYFEWMDEEDIFKFGYLFITQGAAEARKYLDTLKEGLNEVIGFEMAVGVINKLEEEGYNSQQILYMFLNGTLDGIQNWFEGLGNFINPQGIRSAHEFKQMYIIQMLTGNMLPPEILEALNGNIVSGDRSSIYREANGLRDSEFLRDFITEAEFKALVEKHGLDPETARQLAEFGGYEEFLSNVYKFGLTFGNIVPSMTLGLALGKAGIGAKILVQTGGKTVAGSKHIVSFGGKAIEGTKLTIGAGGKIIVGSKTITIGSLASTLLMGTSVAGSEMNAALVDGYDPSKARLYGILRGLTETTFQSFLGNLPGINPQAATTFGGWVRQGLIEGSSQEVMRAFYRQLIFKEEINLDAAELTEAFIMGFLLSALTTSGQTFIRVVKADGQQNIVNITQDQANEILKSKNKKETFTTFANENMQPVVATANNSSQLNNFNINPSVMINGTPITLSPIVMFEIESFYKRNGIPVPLNGMVNINDLPPRLQVDALKTIVNAQVDVVGSLFTDDVLAQIPGGREAHNQFFSVFNTRMNMMQLQLNRGNISPAQALNVLNSLLNDTKTHHNNMIALENQNQTNNNQIPSETNANIATTNTRNIFSNILPSSNAWYTNALSILTSTTGSTTIFNPLQNFLSNAKSFLSKSTEINNKIPFAADLNVLNESPAGLFNHALQNETNLHWELVFNNTTHNKVSSMNISDNVSWEAYKQINFNTEHFQKTNLDVPIESNLQIPSWDLAIIEHKYNFNSLENIIGRDQMKSIKNQVAYILINQNPHLNLNNIPEIDAKLIVHLAVTQAIININPFAEVITRNYINFINHEFLIDSANKLANANALTSASQFLTKSELIWAMNNLSLSTEGFIKNISSNMTPEQYNDFNKLMELNQFAKIDAIRDLIKFTDGFLDQSIIEDTFFRHQFMSEEAFRKIEPNLSIGAINDGVISQYSTRNVFQILQSNIIHENIHQIGRPIINGVPDLNITGVKKTEKYRGINEAITGLFEREITGRQPGYHQSVEQLDRLISGGLINMDQLKTASFQTHDIDPYLFNIFAGNETQISNFLDAFNDANITSNSQSVRDAGIKTLDNMITDLLNNMN